MDLYEEHPDIDPKWVCQAIVRVYEHWEREGRELRSDKRLVFYEYRNILNQEVITEWAAITKLDPIEFPWKGDKIFEYWLIYSKKILPLRKKFWKQLGMEIGLIESLGPTSREIPKKKKKR